MKIPNDRIREIEAASTPTNAEFVPMAQTAISELLAEREERIAELGVMLREIERLKKHTVSCSIYEELYTRAEKAEAEAERLRVQVERLEGRVDEPCDGCTEKALEAVREWTDDPPATLGNTVYLACQAMVRAILDREGESQ